ncbi:MAG: alpha/beta fold hydrolase [Ancalomicrobiaceae bacterium]|nr:alpha/beta fold hydrolase [Ancalomicrobiaceae bacterium]
MIDGNARRIAVGRGAEARDIAVNVRAGAAPGLFWLGGFRSDMGGTKACAVDALGARLGRAVTRFDYSGHGASGGRFEDGTISRWLEDSLAAFDSATAGPQILVGSSMGGWLSLLLARVELTRSPRGQSRVKGMVLIAPALDFTEDLMWARLPEIAKAEILATGRHLLASDDSSEPTPIMRELIEDGRRHLILGGMIETGCPVHILQGRMDADVPWHHAERLVERLASDDVILTYVRDGDHRLSRAADIDLLITAVERMVERVAAEA